LDAVNGVGDPVMVLGEEMESNVPEGAVDCGHSFEAGDREANAMGVVNYSMVDSLTPATEDVGVCLHELVVSG
jgi:hypothetical protein